MQKDVEQIKIARKTHGLPGVVVQQETHRQLGIVSYSSLLRCPQQETLPPGAPVSRLRSALESPWAPEVRPP